MEGPLTHGITPGGGTNARCWETRGRGGGVAAAVPSWRQRAVSVMCTALFWASVLAAAFFGAAAVDCSLLSGEPIEMCRHSFTGYDQAGAVALYATLGVNFACCVALLALCRRHVVGPLRHARWALADPAVRLYETAMWTNTLFMLGYLWWTLAADEQRFVLTGVLTASTVLTSACTSYTAPVDLLSGRGSPDPRHGGGGDGPAAAWSQDPPPPSRWQCPGLAACWRRWMAGDEGLYAGPRFDEHRAGYGLGLHGGYDHAASCNAHSGIAGFFGGGGAAKAGARGKDDGRGSAHDDNYCGEEEEYDDEEALMATNDTDLYARRRARLSINVRTVMLAVAIHNFTYMLYKILEVVIRVEAIGGEGGGNHLGYDYRLSVLATLAGLWYRHFLARFFYLKCNFPWCNVLLARHERAVKGF